MGRLKPQQIKEIWQQKWPDVLKIWSSYTRLQEPIWCLTHQEAKQEGLEGSFAMIRLSDLSIVINLESISQRGLEDFAEEILAHEIGHHILAPADLYDNAKLISRIRFAMPGVEQYAPMISNLWTDLLINDRLMKTKQLNFAGLYQKMGKATKKDAESWLLYMMIYEHLWALPPGSLVEKLNVSESMQLDAGLGARTVRVYSRNWVVGASRFACLMLPYLLKEQERALQNRVEPWLDADQAGAGDEVPDGLTSLDEEDDHAIHPAEDPEISGIEGGIEDLPAQIDMGGLKQDHAPAEYGDLLKSLGVKLTEKEMTMKFYRELAQPMLIRFPEIFSSQSKDPIPEGLEIWDAGESIHQIDWVETTMRGNTVIPGFTTVQRTYGEDSGMEKSYQTVDLYLGIDCSGSMTNPALAISYPVLAGCVMALSALRGRSYVRACLSGESPGKFLETGDYLRDEKAILATLVDYLGTGYSFGIERLIDAFLKETPPSKPTHILLLSDQDWFHMLETYPNGHEIAKQACEAARGGATAVLEIDPKQYRQPIKALEACGWEIHCVRKEKELLTFAKAFSQKTFGKGMI